MAIPAGLSGGELSAWLVANSGLPGPRANLAVADEFAAAASVHDIRAFAASDDEYLALCGAIGLGELLACGDDTLAELHSLAADSRWRVREGVARSLQRLGDVSPERLRELVTLWSSDPDPLVQRAAVAAICEPRLLRDPVMAGAALQACLATTTALLARDDRRAEPVRVLRQALGYAWSVAIAAAPTPGLAAFGLLGSDPDPDVQWIVRENLRKTRLKKLL